MGRKSPSFNPKSAIHNSQFMLVVGLTGGICSGKTTVARIFAKKGAVVLDADEIAHQLQEPGQPVYEAIVRAFGREILKADRRIERAKLGNLVFADPTMRRKLEAIMHPAIVRTCETRIEQAREAGTKICIVDAALLIEARAQERFDRLIVVAASKEVQLERLIQRGLREEEAVRRIRSQMPLEEKVRYAHDFIDNSGSLEETEWQVARIFDGLLREADEKKLDKRIGVLLS